MSRKSKQRKEKKGASFGKIMMGSMVGSFLTILILGGIYAIIMISVLASLATFSAQEVVKVKDNSLLVMKLNQPVPDRSSNNPMENFDFQNFKVKEQPGLNDIIKSIENAKEDDRISGIMLDLSYIPSGIATIEEIRNALLDFKESGKKIYAYSEVYTQSAYYLASVADKIVLNTYGEVMFKGLSMQVMFLKGTMEKLDIEPQIIRHGKFKSAVEPFMNEGMSEANKEQSMKFITSIWDHMLVNISVSRDISVDELNHVADSLLLTNAKAAVAYSFVDTLMYKDQWLDFLKDELNIKESKKINTISIAKYSKVKGIIKKVKDRPEDEIAIVYASGSIGGGQGDDQTIGSERISKALRKARKDSSIKAIVFRVNSPGGDARASEVIWREVKLANEVKPVIVSMGNYAASGGYYISCPATKIVAQPTTLTGSIGVFAVIPNMEKFFKNKLGITVDGVTTNEHSDFMNVYRPVDEYERAVLQTYIEDIYATFIGHVADGRGMTLAEVDSIGQGRIWSGLDAKEIGLVDEIGGIDKAIEIAKAEAGLEDYRIINLPKRKDPFVEMIEELTGNGINTILKDRLGEEYLYYQYIKEMQNTNGVVARLPYEVIIY